MFCSQLFLKLYKRGILLGLSSADPPASCTLKIKSSVVLFFCEQCGLPNHCDISLLVSHRELPALRIPGHVFDEFETPP